MFFVDAFLNGVGNALGYLVVFGVLFLAIWKLLLRKLLAKGVERYLSVMMQFSGMMGQSRTGPPGPGPPPVPSEQPLPGLKCPSCQYGPLPPPYTHCPLCGTALRDSAEWNLPPSTGS